MSTVTIIFNERKITKKGEVPIWLRIIKDRKPKYIALGVKIQKEQWNPDTNKVRKSHPNSQRLNNYIAHKISEAEGIALEMETNNKYTSPRKMKDAVLGRCSESFTKFADMHLEKLEHTAKYGTLSKHKAIIAKFKEFTNNRDICFDELTVPFLKDYEAWLRKKRKNSVNTIHSDLKTIRKLVNDAVREDIFPIEKNPFLRFKLQTAKTEKNFLTEEELETLENIYIKPHLKLNHHRNMYVFCCYTGGLRISDVLQLKWSNYDGERLIIRTKKTDDILSIKVPDKGREILAGYFNEESEPEHFIFPFLKNNVDYTKNAKFLFDSISSATAYANKDLGTLKERCSFNKKLHFHTSRHTFATLALKKGMRIEYLSKLMTHSNIRTTQIYTKIVNAELDTAMDVFNVKPPVLEVKISA